MKSLWFFLISCLYITGIWACDVRVCLTWALDADTITFKCKVNKLKWKIEFLNPSGIELGHCSTPFPLSTCFTARPNSITQNKKTNTTILTLKRYIDISINGRWKCSHGTNRDAAIVNVTVLAILTIRKTGHQLIVETPDQRKENQQPYNQKEAVCCEDFFAWTMFGLIGYASIIFFIWTVVNNFPCCGRVKKSGKDFSKVVQIEFLHKYGRVVAVFVVLTVLIFPAVVGFMYTDCKYKEYFIVFGGTIAVIVHYVLLQDRRSEKDIKLVDNHAGD